MPFWGDTIQPSTGDISGCPCLVTVLSHQKKNMGLELLSFMQNKVFLLTFTYLVNTLLQEPGIY